MWLYWRRPLLIVLMTSCGVSLLTEGYLSLHILGSAAIYWSLLPLTGLMGLIAAERRLPEPKQVDGFFRGYLPAMIWLTAAAAFMATRETPDMGPPGFSFWEITGTAALLAGSWMDYRFFSNRAKFLVSRGVSITLWFGIFMGSWLWSEIAWRLGI